MLTIPTHHLHFQWPDLSTHISTPMYRFEEKSASSFPHSDCAVVRLLTRGILLDTLGKVRVWAEISPIDNVIYKNSFSFLTPHYKANNRNLQASVDGLLITSLFIQSYVTNVQGEDMSASLYVYGQCGNKCSALFISLTAPWTIYKYHGFFFDDGEVAGVVMR